VFLRFNSRLKYNFKFKILTRWLDLGEGRRHVVEDLASEHRDARHDHQRAHRPGPGGGVVKWGYGWGNGEKKERESIASTSQQATNAATTTTTTPSIRQAHPVNEMRRLNLAERSAAMKKVLSPISDTKIREKAWGEGCSDELP
jgi:hypothetical protein